MSERASGSIRQPDELTLALVAATLHVSRLIYELPADDDAVVAEFDAQLEVKDGLVDTLLNDRPPSDAVEDLAVFAAAAVEQWAECSGQDPFELLREFDLTWKQRKRR